MSRTVFHCQRQSQILQYTGNYNYHLLWINTLQYRKSNKTSQGQNKLRQEMPFKQCASKQTEIILIFRFQILFLSVTYVQFILKHKHSIRSQAKAKTNKHNKIEQNQKEKQIIPGTTIPQPHYSTIRVQFRDIIRENIKEYLLLS